MQEVQEFKKLIEGYRPQLNNLETTSVKCCLPPSTPGGPKAAKLTPTLAESSSTVTTELEIVWERYNTLGAVATERGHVLEGFLPSVQQYESSRGAWGQNLEKWEEQVSNLPPPATKPALVEKQIKHIKVDNVHDKYLDT